ncbi:MAG: BatA domain-containing protein, partial [Acetobacteraceae bacterium]
MLFTAPLVLAAFVVLPLLWWLLRVTPPAPRREVFPAVRLLFDLVAPEETPARTPWWVLALRLLAAGLVILGLAGPVLRPGAVLPGHGPVLLAIDNGWAAAAGWSERQRAAAAVLTQAERAGRGVALFATAADGEGAAPLVSPVLPAAVQRARLTALRPEPWPSDRRADAMALARLRARCETRTGGAPAPPASPGRAEREMAGNAAAGRPAAGGTASECPGAVVYLADGLTDGPSFSRFAGALAGFGPMRDLRPTALPQLLLPPDNRAGALILRVAQPPRPVPTQVTVLAETAAGQPLTETRLSIPRGAAVGTAPLLLP